MMTWALQVFKVLLAYTCLSELLGRGDWEVGRREANAA